jgi:hypothetical protein
MGRLGWQQRLDGIPDLIGEELLGHGCCRHGRAASQTANTL